MTYSHSNFNDVGVFHERFNLDNVTFHGPGPRAVVGDLLKFRIKFLREELDEFCEGADEGDPAKMADALIDLVYVAMGTAHLLGYPWQTLWNEVQAANCRKVRAESAEQSKRGSVFDVVKPDGWTPPDVAGILARYGWETRRESD